MLTRYAEPDAPNRARIQKRGRRPVVGRCVPGKPGPPIDPAARYSVQLWDHEVSGWEPWKASLRLMQVRRAIRDAEGRGYSSYSYLVERE